MSGGPPGTVLRDGLVVLPGTVLLGAVGVARDDTAAAPAWKAVIRVDSEPLSAYRAYLDALGLVGGSASNPGCKRTVQPSGRTSCFISLTARLRAGGTGQATVELLTLDGDVTGHYLLVVDVQAHQGQGASADGGGNPGQDSYQENPKEGAGLVATSPHSPARRLPVGGGLPGDNLPRGPVRGDTGPAAGLGGGPYVLLAGTELIAKYGYGSYTGGFNVLLHLTGEVPAEEVLQRYTVQSTQYAGAAPTRSTVTENGIVYTRVSPPGGAGGFQAQLVLVDQPGNLNNYLFYDLVND